MQAHAPKEFIPVTSTIHSIAAGKSWSQLEHNEKMYAYWMAKACWQGSRICWFQRSAESPALLVLFHSILHDVQKTKELNKDVTEEQWQQFFAYAAAVFGNNGNFKSFGDSKFVPQVAPALFK